VSDYVPIIEAERVDPDRDCAWVGFLESAANATFYHGAPFNNLYARKTKSIAYLLFRQHERPIAALAGGVIDAAGHLELRSPFSASFGGFVLGQPIGLGQVLGIVKALEHWCRKGRIERITIQNAPLVYWQVPDETCEFGLRMSGFESVSDELCYYLCAETPFDAVVARNARKAVQAGCEFLETDDCLGVWEFLAAAKAVRGHSFDFSSGDLLALRDALGTNVRCFEVRRAGQRIAAAIVYQLNQRIALGFHWGQSQQAQEFRPTDLLIKAIAEWAFERGLSALDLGTVTIGGRPVEGVARFKEKFRPKGMIRRRFSKKLD
jgi:hypothetical protein